MTNPFLWLRAKVRDAILDGVADGLDALDAGPAAAVPPAAMERLQQRLALPAAANLAPSGMELETTTRSNGKRGGK